MQNKTNMYKIMSYPLALVMFITKEFFITTGILFEVAAGAYLQTLFI